MNNMAFKVFISHCMENIGLVEQIRIMFEQKGLEAYIAVSNFQPGKPIDEKIIENIKSSNIFLLLYTKAAEKSNWVQNEIGIAVTMKKHIIPIIEEGVEAPPLLQGLEHIKLDTNDANSCIQKVCDYLTKIKVSKEDRKSVLAPILLFIGAVVLAALISDDEEKDEAEDPATSP